MSKKVKIHDIPKELAKQHDVQLGKLLVNLKIGNTIHKVRTVLARGDIFICPICKKPKDEVPLILFPEGTNFEIDFCFDCARSIGLMNAIQQQQPFLEL